MVNQFIAGKYDGLTLTEISRDGISTILLPLVPISLSALTLFTTELEERIKNFQLSDTSNCFNACVCQNDGKNRSIFMTCMPGSILIFFIKLHNNWQSKRNSELWNDLNWKLNITKKPPSLHTSKKLFNEIFKCQTSDTLGCFDVQQSSINFVCSKQTQLSRNDTSAISPRNLPGQCDGQE